MTRSRSYRGSALSPPLGLNDRVTCDLQTPLAGVTSNSCLDGIDGDASHPEGPKVVLERKDVLDAELVTEDAVEVIDERNLLVVVFDELVRGAVEDRFSDVEDIERRRFSDSPECRDCLAVPRAVEERGCGFGENVPAREHGAVREVAVPYPVYDSIRDIVMAVVSIEQRYEGVGVDEKRSWMGHASFP